MKRRIFLKMIGIGSILSSISIEAKVAPTEETAEFSKDGLQFTRIVDGHKFMYLLEAPFDLSTATNKTLV